MLEWIDDITRFIFLEDDPKPADILFIPGNGHAEPSEWAAKLYLDGYAPLIFALRTLFHHDRSVLRATDRKSSVRRTL